MAGGGRQRGPKRRGGARSEPTGIVWTRERLLEAAGFKFVADTKAAVDRLREIVQTKDEQQALRACELTFDLADVRPRLRVETGDATRPVAVEIVLTHQPNPQPGLEIVDVTPGALMPIPGPMPGLAKPEPIEAAEVPAP